jgi:ADP-ribose pyrophosphatase YjhB (NUDIX family)
MCVYSDQLQVAIFDKLTKNLPKFDDGRVDFSNASCAPVVNAIVSAGGKILILKRSEKVCAYRGKWNCVGGFIDRPHSAESVALKELYEETSIPESEILSVREVGMRRIDDPEICKTWYQHLVSIELFAQPKIQLNWEHTDYAWVTSAELKQYSTTPGLDVCLELVCGRR